MKNMFKYTNLKSTRIIASAGKTQINKTDL